MNSLCSEGRRRRFDKADGAPHPRDCAKQRSTRQCSHPIAIREPTRVRNESKMVVLMEY